MRELYACQLSLAETPGSRPIRQLVEEWIARPLDIDPRAFEDVAETGLIEGNEQTVEVGHVSMADGPGATYAWRGPDDVDPTLDWRRHIAVAPTSPGITTFTVRIGLERRGDELRVAPPRYAFASPAIVRTLLREHTAADAGLRLEPLYRLRRAGDIDHLTQLIRSPQRRLPVVVVSRHPSGDRIVDAVSLAHQLAGLAHVEVLATHLAALALTDELGREHSAWNGAVRLYWPGFDDASQRDPLWTPRHLTDRDAFIQSIRSWLGTLAAAEVPENPAVREARRLHRQRLRDDATLPPWIEEYIDNLEQDRAQLKADCGRLEVALLDAQASLEAAGAELRDVRAQFKVLQVVAESEDEPLDLETLTIAGAFELAKQEASDHVLYLPDCDDSVAAFATYDNPRRFYEALSAIADAASAWADGTLGQGFGQFFADRGYEFSSRNPAARARRTRAAYRRSYAGSTIAMEPHLKVDQSTSPDQCLRVYWYLDERDHRVVIGHVGRHLPD